jgi:multidrug resistance protein, MATE family
LSSREEAKALLKLGLPMMVAQGGLMTMGLVDAFIVGRVSSREMGAVALGNGISGVLIVLGVGLSMGIEPLVSQAWGAGEKDGAQHWLWQGIYCGLLAAIPLGVLTMSATLLFEPFGVASELADRTTSYLWSRMPGLAFNCVYSACRSYLTSIGRTRPVVIAVVSANVINAIVDAILVFQFGLGAVGVGLATSVCWILMTSIALGSIVMSEGARRSPPVRDDMRKVLRLGWPIGLQISVEVGIFALVSMMIARFGEQPLAGHQIALTLSSAIFMCAVGIAVAATARVGHHIGAGHSELARRTGFIAIGIGVAIMAVGGVVFLVFNRQLAVLFAPNDPEVQRWGMTLLKIAAVFAISDGIQVVSAGCLRGAGDTRWPFYANVCAHWVIGLPLVLLLGHGLDLGPIGYWWALTAGLACIALMLGIRFYVLSSRPIARV